MRHEDETAAIGFSLMGEKEVYVEMVKQGGKILSPSFNPDGASFC